jgi:COPI associated protein
MNFFCCLLMLTNAILRCCVLFGVLPSAVTGGTLDLSYYIMAFYLLGFSVLLGAAEYRWPSVLIYLQFLRSRMGKGLFLVLLGLLVFDDRTKYDVLIGITLVLVGIFNVIVSCMRRDIDQKEWEKGQGEEEDEIQYGSEDEEAERFVYRKNVP